MLAIPDVTPRKFCQIGLKGGGDEITKRAAPQLQRACYDNFPWAHFPHCVSNCSQ